MKIFKKIIAVVFALILLFGVACRWDANDATNSSTQNPSSSNSSPSDSSSENSSSDNTSGVSTDSSQNSSETQEQLIVQFDGTTLYWSDVYAEVYKVTVGSQSAFVANLQYTPEIKHGVYLATVEAYADIGSPKIAEASIEIAIKCPPPELSKDGNALKWNALSGAKHYNVYLNEAFIAQSSTNSYTPTQNGSYTVCAVFEDERLNSDMSKSIVFGAVPIEPPILSINEGVISWTKVSGALYYQILFNGTARQVVSSTFTPSFDIDGLFLRNPSLKNEFPKDSVIEITVCAINELSSKLGISNPVYYTVK